VRASVYNTRRNSAFCSSQVTTLEKRTSSSKTLRVDQISTVHLCVIPLMAGVR
jgi:hypothetical protein